MARLAKKTDNEIVAEWLIENRWRNSLNTDTKQKMPAFVDDAVMAAVYIVAGTSNGQVNISPKLVFKCLMLNSITSELVKTREVGYEMSDRQARRLAQTVRFALDGIRHRIQEYESQISDEEKENTAMEKEFIRDYYQGRQSKLHSPAMAEIPSEILALREEGKYLEYGLAVQAFRSK
jgi:hypothetical protein